MMSWPFDVPPEPRSVWSIIGWWELRRVLYNLALCLVGGASFVLLLLLVDLERMVNPDDDVDFLVLPVAFVLANVAYTGGWVVELLVRLIWRDRYPHLGPKLLKLGLLLTLNVVLLPPVASGVALLVGYAMGAARW